MKRDVLISVREEDWRVAVLEDGRLVEYLWEFKAKNTLKGAIFKGRVIRVSKGGAFVDIGLERPGYLNSKDVPDVLGDLEVGQEIPVQVVNTPLPPKGPRLTAKISIGARYVVLEPWNNRIGVSRKIGCGNERERLKEIVREASYASVGYVVRTAAEGKKREEITAEVEALNNLWTDISRQLKNLRAPVKVYEEPYLPIRAIRDLAIKDVKIWIDDEEEYDRALRFLDTWAPDVVGNVRLYKDSEPMFVRWGLVSEIAGLVQRRINLTSKGELIIDFTEAMTVFDVNAPMAQPIDISRYFFEINESAIREVARQIRLRNIGGIIVVDLINLNDQVLYEKLLEVFLMEAAKDRARVSALVPSKFGIMEIVRQKLGDEQESLMWTGCEACGGSGFIPSAEFVGSIAIDRALEVGIKKGLKKVRIQGGEDVIAAIGSVYSRTLERIRTERGINIELDVSDMDVRGFKIG